MTANAATRDIKVANMSLGGAGRTVRQLRDEDPLHQAICNSTAAGVIYAAAAGNSGWDFDYPRRLTSRPPTPRC